MKIKFASLFAILFILIKADAQFALSAKIHGNYNLSNKQYFRIESGLAPELNAKWLTKSTAWGLHYQRINWFLSEEYISSMRTHLIEISFGLHKKVIKDHRMEFGFHFGHAANRIRFDLDKRPDTFGYTDDFIWKNLSYAFEIEFQHTSSVLASIGYRRVIGNSTMPEPNPVYLTAGFGYRYIQKK
jgi:hypothetical protein